MKAKYEYLVSINGGKGKVVFTDISYGKTKDIELYIGKGKASFRFMMTMCYREPSEYFVSLLKHLVKKVIIAHLLKYSQILLIKTISLLINDEIVEMDLSSIQHPHILIPNRKCRDIHENLDNDSISTILRIKKSDEDHRKSMIMSYVSSKLRDNVYERFSDNWISFNSMYSYVFEYEKDNGGIEADLKDYEQNKMKVLAEKYSLNICDNRKKRNGTCKHVCDYLYNNFEQCVIAELLSDPNSTSTHNIQEIISAGVSIESFFVFDFSYYIRCRYFHGETPLPLVSYDDDYEMLFITLANSFLERFLDNHIREVIVLND